MSRTLARPSPASPASSSDRRAWLGLVTVSLGVSLVVVDFTIVNVVMPPIIDDLDVSAVGAQWIQESYAIALAALLLVTGRLTDLLGARRLFAAGTVLFGLASIGAAAAPTGGLLIAARVAQGVGGAIVMPTSLALLNLTFRGPDRGKAFAVWGSTIGAAAAVGPLLGGWLAGYSWRWAFGINIAVVALILAGAARYLPPSPRRPGRLDATGAMLSVPGLGLLAFALIEGREYGWWAPRKALGPFGDGAGLGLSVVPVALAAAAGCLALFLRRQARPARRDGTAPLVDTSLFRIKSFSTGTAATLLIALAEFGLLAVLPLWLQYALGYSPVRTGLLILVVAIGSFAASGASFGLAEKAGPIGLVRTGLALEAAGLLMFGLLADSDSPWWVIAAALFLYGTGVGFATAQVTNVVLADVPPQRAGQGSGIQSAARQLGSALGIAVLTSTFFTALATDLSDRLTRQGTPGADHLSSTVTDSAGAMISGLASDPRTASVAQAAREAMSHAVRVDGCVCAALLALGMLATFLIPRPAAS
ncbi:DHA2 family efflux MFS transporter permease subunit [Kitasatospora sp. NPDC101183]|uniref:DHA2 family efflux MFS transporter permease subunit n=1 Tax=Kitasatospora sp. NPDC101183 TaxID=3364100 RepID=UPI00382AC5E2